MYSDYEFIVAGRVSSCLVAELNGFTARFDGGVTRLVGRVRDQAEREGAAARLRDAGYEIVAMVPVGREATSQDHPG